MNLQEQILELIEEVRKFIVLKENKDVLERLIKYLSKKPHLLNIFEAFITLSMEEENKDE